MAFRIGQYVEQRKDDRQMKSEIGRRTIVNLEIRIYPWHPGQEFIGYKLRLFEG